MSHRVSFGAASNCQIFRKMDKGQRRDRCKKYNLCRRCLKSLKKVKHLAQDCPAPLCANCDKDHHVLICPNERTEQKLHKVQGDDEDDDDKYEDEDFYQDGDFFDEDQQFHFSQGPEYDDGDDFQNCYQSDDKSEE